MRVIIALTALVVSAAAAAESISSIEVTSLDPIGGDSAQTRVVAIDDRAVVLQPGVVRVYGGNRKRWIESRWPEEIRGREQEMFRLFDASLIVHGSSPATIFRKM